MRQGANRYHTANDAATVLTVAQRPPPPTGIFTLSYSLLHGDLVVLARRLRDETATPTGPPKREPPALGAIILSAAAVEAAINHRVESAFYARSLTQGGIYQLAHERVKEERAPYRKIKLLSLAMGFTPPWDEDPWRYLPDLFELRHALVHYNARPVYSSVEGNLFENKQLKLLAQRLALFSIHEAGGTWLDVFLNRPCADWAVTTAEAALKALDSPPWIREG